nr:isopeptide-forming domain-containing fimbrial protein [uncultured Albidiferax sp.]
MTRARGRGSNLCCCLLWVWLLTVGHAFAATAVSNTATIAPPSGVVDSGGGCTTAVPPVCGGNNTSTAEVAVWAVTVAKSVNPITGSTVVAGQTVTYTLTATVTGAATTTPVVLTDTLGANLTFGTVTSPGVYTAGGSGQVRTFTLPVGAAVGTHTVTYTATVNVGATGTVDNAVTGAPCSFTGGCATSNPIGAVSVTKALIGESGVLPGVAEPGETLTYTVTLGNQTLAPVPNYPLTDTLGAGLTFVSTDNGGVNAGQTTTWAGLTIPASGSLVITVRATVNAPITGPSVRNIAKRTGEPDPICPGTACVVTPTVTTVTVAKSVDPVSGATVVAGQTLTYTLTAMVTGPATTTPTVLTDTLSANLTFDAVSSAGVYTAGGNGQVRTFTLPAGTVAGSYAVRYTVHVNAGATGSVNNAVTGGPCTFTGGCTTANPVGLVSVSKALIAESGTQSGIAEPGETLTYTITLGNQTLAAVPNFPLTDTLGAGLTFVSTDNGGVNAGQTTTWAGLTIPASGSLVITVRATVNAPITGPSVRNIAKRTGEPDPICPGTACVVTPTASTVTVAKSVDPVSGSTVVAGQSLSYTLTATVTGGATTTPTVLTDTLGANLTFGSVTAPGVYTASGSGQVRSFSLPAGMVAGTYSVIYTASVNLGATGTVDNAVTGAPCTFTGGCTTSNPVGAVSVTKALTAQDGTQSGLAEAGETLTYTITLGNATLAPVPGYSLTDTLGAGLTFVSADNGGVNVGQTTTWTGLTVPASGTLVVTVRARVNSPITTLTVRNLAKRTGEPDPVCPGISCVVTPTAPTVTIVAKTSDPVTGSTVLPGQTIRYTVITTVTGGPTTTPTVLTDTLSDNLTFGTLITAGPFTVEGSGGVHRFTLPAGTAVGTFIVSYTATVNGNATGAVNNAVTGADCSRQGACSTIHPLGAITLSKALTAESGTQAGIAEPGETLTYTILLGNQSSQVLTGYALTDTMRPGLTFVSSSPAGVNSGLVTNWTNLQVPAGGTLPITVTVRVNQPVTTAFVRNIAKPTGSPDPACPSLNCVQTPTAPFVSPQKQLTAETGSVVRTGEPGEQLTYTITFTNSGGSAFNNYRFTENVPAGATLSGVTGASGFGGPLVGPAAVNLVVPTVPVSGSAVVTVTFAMAATLPAGMSEVANVISGGDIDPACAAACTVSIPVENPNQLSIIKTVAVREARIGDLVRYTLTLTNLGATNVVDARIVDTPPMGFTVVAGSVAVIDGDGSFTASPGAYPMQVSGIDVAAGRQAVITYLLRVGAGVRQGLHVNQAVTTNTLGRAISNTATAQVNVVADPLVDEALILGTVFDDRDGDGWQDPAALSEVRVQGGFAPGAYVPGSTTVDRGQGPQAQADASAPMLHGLSLGGIAGRQSQADPETRHQVVIRQRLREPAFTDDFVLTNAQGVTVRMNAAGATTVEKSGDAAKGLNGAMPTVERRVASADGGYTVDYVIRNTGIEERGIPGVRVASVEGVLIETDQFGRYHLIGVSGGDMHRGRNFILKVDPSTLPAGAVFTTPNPLVRRVTPGLPVRFDFGSQLPIQTLQGREMVDIELGEFLFTPGSRALRPEHGPVIEKMAAKVNAYQGGDLVIRANGETQALALGRVEAVQAALQPLLSPAAASATRITVRTEVQALGSTVVGVQGGQILLGTVLFDTDKTAIRTEFKPLITQVVERLRARGGGVVGIVGHADQRASDAYNLDLGLRRARAVFEAIAAELPASLRTQVRVETVRGERP